MPLTCCSRNAIIAKIVSRADRGARNAFQFTVAPDSIVAFRRCPAPCDRPARAQGPAATGGSPRRPPRCGPQHQPARALGGANHAAEGNHRRDHAQHQHRPPVATVRQQQSDQIGDQNPDGDHQLKPETIAPRRSAGASSARNIGAANAEAPIAMPSMRRARVRTTIARRDAADNRANAEQNGADSRTSRRQNGRTRQRR